MQTVFNSKRGVIHLDMYIFIYFNYGKDKFILPMTSEEIKRIFRENGLSVSQFARAHGFSEPLVRAVLSGKNKASRGQSHLIAVTLGLKSNPSEDCIPDFVRKSLSQQAPHTTAPSSMEAQMT